MSKKVRKSPLKKAIVVALIILLPVLSLAIGFFGVQFLMEDTTEETPPKTEKTTKELLESKDVETSTQNQETSVDDEVKDETVETTDEANSDETAMIYTLPNMVTYNIQIGSFGEQSNANKKELACAKDGFGAYVYNADNYKVFVMSFFDRNQAEVNQVIAADVYEGAYIAEIEISPGQITYTDADKAYIHELKQDLQTIQDIHKSYTNYVHTYDLAAFDPDDFSVYLITQHNEITKVKEKIMGYTVSEGLKKQHGALIDYLEQMENHFKYLINLEKPSRVDVWDRYMEIIFDYANLA